MGGTILTGVHCTADVPLLYRTAVPLQEKDEYVTSIIDDMRRLGLRFDTITYTSDYFAQLKDCGERLIRAGARVCAWPRPVVWAYTRVGGGGGGGDELACLAPAQALRPAPCLFTFSPPLSALHPCCTASTARQNKPLPATSYPHLTCPSPRPACAGHLYADDTPVDVMREERMAGTDSRCRGRSVEENLRLWGEMFAASEEGE